MNAQELKEQYKKTGFIGPVEIMSKEESLEYQKLILKAEEEHNLMKSMYRNKSNLLFPWIDKLSKHPKIIEHVTNLLGPNIWCWNALFWVKYPNDGRNVGFHQDATYWNFDKKDKALTLWIAFNDLKEEHGTIEYVSGSHVAFQRKHIDVKDGKSLLLRGQEVEEEVSKERIKTIVPAGHALIHSPYIIHGSSTNNADTPRFAIGLIFASTECAPLIKTKPEVTAMIAGTDEYNYMKHEPTVTGDWEVDLKNWQKTMDDHHENYVAMNQGPYYQ
jgi:ectoine hydroxylase-related dioxygenase (phytanoyl-CoA dioxygenase family)